MLLIRRQWASRLRSANAASGKARAVLEGRSPVSKSAVSQANKTGLPLVDVYRQRLAELQAEILICHAAIQVIDSERGNHRYRNHPAMHADAAAHQEEPGRPRGSGGQRNLF